MNFPHAPGPESLGFTLACFSALCVLLDASAPPLVLPQEGMQVPFPPGSLWHSLFQWSLGYSSSSIDCLMILVSNFWFPFSREAADTESVWQGFHFSPLLSQRKQLISCLPVHIGWVDGHIGWVDGQMSDRCTQAFILTF